MSDELLVVTNAAAGTTSDETVRAARAVWDAADRTYEVVETSGPDELDQALEGRGDRVVVVVGGDGSLHAVARALEERGELGSAVVGLVPLGTGNDLARGAGIPLDAAEAARVVLEGRPRALDALEDSAGGVVVNAVNAGIGAAASERAAPYKPRLGPIGYVVGAVSAGLRETGWHLRVEVDGEVVTDGEVVVDGSRRVLHLVVGNGPTVGGGAAAAPGARLADGQADVVVSLAAGPLARLGYATRLRRGGHVERSDVVTARGRQVVVSGEPFPWNVDGEIGRPRRDATWTVRPAAWRLLLPA